MSCVKSLSKNCKKEILPTKRITMRKHLNVDALYKTMRNGFDNITDHRSGKTSIDLKDALMLSIPLKITIKLLILDL